jgi:hypothetical protein
VERLGELALRDSKPELMQVLPLQPSKRYFDLAAAVNGSERG